MMATVALMSEPRIGRRVVIGPTGRRRVVTEEFGEKPLPRRNAADGKTYPATANRDFRIPSKRLVDLRAAGWSYRKIGAEVGVSHQTIMRLFQNLALISESD